MQELYNDEDLKTMRIAEQSRLIAGNKIQEIMNFARKSGIRRIGVAYCILLKKEALKLVELLNTEFEVYAINCYTGRIPSKDLLKNDSKGISYNPAGQAKYLNEQNTELNIV